MKKTKTLADSRYTPIHEAEYQRVREDMLNRYKQSQMQFELQLFKDRQQWIIDDPLSEWFLASRERTALFHRFNLDGFPDGHTVSMESRALGIDRSQMSRMLSEAHTLGFIYRNKKPKKQRFYLPSQHLLNNGTWYAEYYVSQILSIERWPDREGFFNLKRVENVTRQNMRGNHVDFSDPFIESSRIETIDPRVSSKEGETTSARDKAPNGQLPVRTTLAFRGRVVGS